MISLLLPAEDLLRRYAGPDTGFVGYPDPSRYATGFDEQAFRACARETNEDPIPRRLSVHLHIPFAQRACLYARGTHLPVQDRTRLGPYLDRLARECAQVAPLFDRDRDVVQLKVGGAGPSLLDSHLLTETLEALSRQFFLCRSREREFMIELDPLHLDAEEAARYAGLGFNRARFTVLDPDPAVVAACGRREDPERLAEAVRLARAAGFRSVCFDVMHALPGQRLEVAQDWLERVLALRPDRISLLPLGPEPLAEAAARGVPPLSPQLRIELHTQAVCQVLDAGYDAIGLDVFALPADDLSRARRSGQLHRNPLGYTPHAETDLIGLGVSALSRIGDARCQNFADPAAWQDAVDRGRLPVWRGLRLDAEGQLRYDVIQGLLCHGRIEIEAIEQRYGIDFRAHFRNELERLRPMLEAGLLQQQAGCFALGALGRLALRSIGAIFAAGPPGAA